MSPKTNIHMVPTRLIWTCSLSKLLSIYVLEKTMSPKTKVHMPPSYRQRAAQTDQPKWRIKGKIARHWPWRTNARHRQVKIDRFKEFEGLPDHQWKMLLGKTPIRKIYRVTFKISGAKGGPCLPQNDHQHQYLVWLTCPTKSDAHPFLQYWAVFSFGILSQKIECQRPKWGHSAIKRATKGGPQKNYFH